MVWLLIADDANDLEMAHRALARPILATESIVDCVEIYCKMVLFGHRPIKYGQISRRALPISRGRVGGARVRVLGRFFTCNCALEMGRKKTSKKGVVLGWS